MAVIDALVAVIPMLGLLIVVHELGHFLVAKAVGVRVLKFSVGFGAHRDRQAASALGAQRQRVRDRLDPARGLRPDARRALSGRRGRADPGRRARRRVPRAQARLAAASASCSPAMNLLLPVVCLDRDLWGGIDRLDAVVGMVDVARPRRSPASRRAIGSSSSMAKRFGTTERRSRRSASTRRATASCLEVERHGERPRSTWRWLQQEVRDGFGGNEEIGWIGISHDRRDARVALPDPASEAARAPGCGRGIGCSPSTAPRSTAGRSSKRPIAAPQGAFATLKIERPQPLDDAEVARYRATGERSESQTDELTLRCRA